MKAKLPLRIIFLLILSVLFFRTDDISASQTEVFSISNGFISTSDFFIDDYLDSRDENNQPVKSFSAQQELKDIFQSGLYTLLAVKEIHSFAVAFSILEGKINAGMLGFTSSASGKVREIVSVLAPSVKRFWFNILANICGLSCFKTIPIFFFTLCILHFALLELRAPLSLRC